MVDLTDIATLKSLCRQYHVRPDPDAGQHFLVNRPALMATVEAAALTSEDSVVEVGPGFGALTVELAQRAGRVIAVELDPKLAAVAREILQPYPNVEIIQGNFLRFNPDNLSPSGGSPEGRQLTTDNFKLVANLPYGITGRFFRQVLSGAMRPQQIVVMVQAEVAERMCAPPGQLSVLGVWCQLQGEPRIVLTVPRQYFWPPPAVDSAVISMPVQSPAAIARRIADAEIGLARVMRLVRVGFAARRKTLVNNLRALGPRSGGAVDRKHILSALYGAKIAPQARAQEVAVGQWITLAKNLKNYLN